MKRLSNTINKAFILNNANQVEIFAHYLDIDESTIQDCISTGSLIQSPIRADKAPSVGFRYNAKNILKMRDFGGYFWGDCFDVVAYVLTRKGTVINIKKGDHFKYVLNHIAVEMDIANGIKEDSIPVLVHQVRKTKRLITFEPRSWNMIDSNIWITKYHKLLTFDYLSMNYVYPVERYWIDSYSQPEPKYYYTSRDPCYAYYLGQDENNISNIRLYFPNRGKDNKRPKFISNNNSFQGILNSNDKYDYIVLIKSYKDALVLRRIFDTFSFTGNLDVWVIGYPSENYVLSMEVVNWLYTKLKEPSPQNIINFTDFDFTGRRCANHVNTEFGIPYVFITNGEFGLPNHGVKDLSDFIEKYKANAAASLIDEFIKITLNEYENNAEDIWY